MRKYLTLFMIMTVVSFGCHKADSQKDGVTYSKIDLTDVDEDFVLPTSLWNTLESNYPELTVIAVAPKAEGEEKKEKVRTKPDPKTEEAKREEEELLKKRPSLDGLKFTLLLVEKTEGLLDHHNFEITFGSGGGSIDLKDYLPEKKNGSFFLKVNYDQPMNPKKIKIYYLSNAPYRADLKMGSGCNKYFDITQFWTEAMKDEGLNLNTVNQRHLSVLAGTFVFVSPVQGKLRLGHLTVRDTRHLELLCKPEIRN